jgi:glycosyltransferase involved in cell wall biosynthesis
VTTSPLVSIVIPCYNAAATLGKAIQSALEQTWPRKEVIVIDDGSTDGSRDVIASFGPSVRWEARRNRGGAAARNRGVEIAKGHFVQFLDADDTLAPRKLSVQLEEAERHRNRITYCDYWFHGRAGPPTLMVCRQAHPDPVVFVLRHLRLQTSVPLHRRDWFLGVGGFREQLRGSQEIDLHLRLAAAGHGFVRVPEPLAHIYETEGSVSANYVATAAEQLKFLPDVLRRLREANELTEERSRAFAAFAARQARACFQRGSSEVAAHFVAFAAAAHAGRGLSDAYDEPARTLCRLLGPRLTESLVVVKRTLISRSRTGS